jgi:hypothetical protein
VGGGLELCGELGWVERALVDELGAGFHDLSSFSVM